MTEPEKPYTITGVVVTVAATACFIWGGLMLLDKGPAAEDRPEIMRENEIQAYKHLKKIVDAQKRYIKTDWDNDGRQVYATFLAHLRQSVDKDGNPIPVNLLPEKLAFAMGPARAVDGYYFEDLYAREVSGISRTGRMRTTKLDYGKEWAAAALPAVPDKPGLLVFVADQSGGIFAREILTLPFTIPVAFPGETSLKNWTRIESANHLKRMDRKNHY